MVLKHTKDDEFVFWNLDLAKTECSHHGLLVVGPCSIEDVVGPDVGWEGAGGHLGSVPQPSQQVSPSDPISRPSLQV